MNKKFFLPGTDKQLDILLKNLELKDLSALVIGEGSEEISKIISSQGAAKVVMLVQNEDSLLRARMSLSSSKEISVKMMEFENTDFKNYSFDLVYAQASISSPNRNKIIKEIKRILKPSGYFCLGEIIKSTKSPPQFVKDIWNNSNVAPLFTEELEDYYKERGFEIILSNDISETLYDFYLLSNNLLKDKSTDLPADEKSYYKKLLKQISHESNVYLKLGGNAHIGFKVLIMKKV
ncbi:MAG: methyltransferase domain-containing protein [Ignavibacteriaceae bacterium]